MKDYLLIFKALSHKTRLQIVLMLKKKSLCVHQITELIGCSMATISTHLKILKDANLIISEKVDQHVYYKTNCISCGDNCYLCKIFDEMLVDKDTLSLLDEVKKNYSGEAHNCPKKRASS